MEDVSCIIHHHLERHGDHGELVIIMMEMTQVVLVILIMWTNQSGDAGTYEVAACFVLGEIFLRTFDVSFHGPVATFFLRVQWNNTNKNTRNGPKLKTYEENCFFILPLGLAGPPYI